MNTLNTLTNLYGCLYNRKFVPSRALSPLRYTLRWVANKVLPIYLAHSTRPKKAKKCNDTKKIIVSMTSFPGRIDTVWMVVECMLRQTMKPDAVILYLSKEQFPSYDDIPLSLRMRQDDVFKIQVVSNDFRSHKKYLYAFKDYANDIVITIDDDIFYPTTMIESLYKQYKNNPNAVVCRHAKCVLYDDNKKLRPYREWLEVSRLSVQNCIFLTGGGTLFVPSKLYKDVTKIDLAVKLCPLADDIWLFAMTKLGNLSVFPITRMLTLPIYSKSNESLCSVNVGQDLNDAQIKNIVEHYQRDVFGEG